MTPITRGAAVLLAVLMTAGCAREPAPAPSAPANLVIVTIDTLRADRIGRGFTPAIDALAASGRRYTTARAVVPLTLPSHVTIMTGLLPAAHGVRENGVVFSPSDTRMTLAQTLRRRGYATAAFVGAYVLNRRFGLADGFDVYDDTVRRDAGGAASLESDRRAAEVVDAARNWLQSARAPFFAWIHLYDPHAPYDPPPEFRARAGGDAYNGEVAYVDAQVGRVMELLRSRGLDRSTLVVVGADHGEGLGEHGERTHGMLVYDSTLRVPLSIAGPGIAAATVRTPVSLADLAPSLLARLGVEPARREGHVDLFADPPARDVYAESLYPRAAGWHALTALAGERWKLVQSGETELYDLAADPGELTNRAGEEPRIASAMSDALRRLTAQMQASPAAAPRGASGDAAERLRALGYVSGSSSSGDGATGPNPARVIGAWHEFEIALAAVTAGRSREAVAPLRALAAKFPGSAIFQSTYARALKDSGNARAAVAVYRAAIARHPADASLFHDLAVAARAAGDAAEALRAEQAALALDASDPAALNGLGLLHVDAGRSAEAAAAFERAAASDPGNASYWANLGNARRESGNVAGAEEAYRRALAVDRNHADASNGLGVLLVQQRRAADAVGWFERALERAPDFHEARLNLGIAYQESGNAVKAGETYRRLLATAPPSARRERQAARELLAQITKR